MALFPGEDLVDVPTPSGQILKLPRSVVPSSVLQQIGTAPQPQNGFTDETAYNVNEPFPSAGGMPNIDENGIVQPPDMTAPAPQQRVITPANAARVQARDAQGKAAQAKADAAQAEKDAAVAKQQAAYAGTPAGQQATLNQATQNNAEQMVKDTTDQVDLEAAGHDIIGRAYADRQAHLDELYAKQAKDAQADYDAEQSKLSEIGTMRKKIEGTKIDHSADHPILAAIGIALSGIGSAMKKEDTNPALDIFWKAIDRKVNAQMQNLDLLKDQYGMSKDELQLFKDKSHRHLELYNTLLAGEADKAAKQVEAIGAQLQGDQTRARAKVLADQIREQANNKALEAMHWGLDYDQKDRHQKQQLALGYTQANETRRHNMVDEQNVQAGQYLDYQKGLASIKSTGDTARYKAALEGQKENETRGIGNPTTGQMLLTSTGYTQMKQADSYEAKAKEMEAAATGPMGRTSEQNALIQQYRDRASELRGTASLENTFRTNDPTEAGKLSDVLSSGQQITSLVDDINTLYDAPSGGRKLVLTDANRAAIQAKSTELAMNLKTAWGLGVLSKNDIQLLGQATGGFDPEKVDTGVLANWLTKGLAGTDPSSFKDRINTLARDTERATVLKLHGRHWDVSDPEQIKNLFHRTTAATDTPEGKAIQGFAAGQGPVAAEAASQPGLAGKVRDTVQSGVVNALTFGNGGAPQYQVDQANAANSGSITRLGLSPDQAKSYDEAIKLYKSGSQQMGPMLTQQALNMAATRPTDAIALITNLQTDAPKLAAQIRTSLPPGEVKDAVDAAATKVIGVSELDPAILRESILSTMSADGKPQDEAALGQLIHIATSKGPQSKEAGQALHDILKESGLKKLPAGSVFREGR